MAAAVHRAAPRSLEALLQLFQRLAAHTPTPRLPHRLRLCHLLAWQQGLEPWQPWQPAAQPGFACFTSSFTCVTWSRALLVALCPGSPQRSQVFACFTSSFTCFTSTNVYWQQHGVSGGGLAARSAARELKASYISCLRPPTLV
jgi:hypothetical protein